MLEVVAAGHGLIGNSKDQKSDNHSSLFVNSRLKTSLYSSASGAQYLGTAAQHTALDLLSSRSSSTTRLVDKSLCALCNTDKFFSKAILFASLRALPRYLRPELSAMI